MLGVILSAISSLFQEVANVIGKNEISNHREGLYSMAFLTHVWGFGLFAILICAGTPFRFASASVPFFVLKLFLEIIQTHITINAIVRAQRSTFGFVRTLTILLLVLVDISLGYIITPYQAVGIGCIAVALAFLFLSKECGKEGLHLVLLSAIGSTFTVSLHKYNITHFNSVAAESFLTGGILVVYFFALALLKDNENPLQLLRKKAIFFQSWTDGLAAIFSSFSYQFAPASVIMAAHRSSAVTWSLAAGSLYFHEKHVLYKASILALLVVGIVILAFS